MLPSVLSGCQKLLATSGSLFTRNSSTMPPLHDVSVATEKAVFAMGCFWGCDTLYGATLGVVRTRVGFTGGTQPIPPTYKKIGDHTEAIEVDFDPNEVSYAKLLELFWANHDPTARCSKQYTSIIFYFNDDQKALAEKTRLEQQAKYNSKIVTAIEPAGTFYNAEDYHQKYRLQQHTDLMAALGLRCNTAQLTASHVAARVNGYVAGMGGVAQFDAEADKLGMTDSAKEKIRKLVIKYEGSGIAC